MSEWGDKLLTEADNARLRAENEKLHVELTDLRLNSCPSCGIKVENEKLRERVHELEIEYDGATTAVLEKTERIEWIAGRLRGETNENTKLRELVAELYQCSRQCGCDTCGYKDDCTMIDRMAELGIEVEA